MASTPQVMPTTAVEWNELMRQTAAANNIDLNAEVKKADLPGDRERNNLGQFVSTPAAAAAQATHEDDTEAPTVYKQTFSIGGKDVEFDGASPEEILLKVSAALKVAPATSTAAATSSATATPDPAAEEKRRATMFDIGLKLQQGDPTAIEAYLKESDYVTRYFAEQGVNIAELKAASTERASNAVGKAWDDATTAWLQDEKNDYPGGDQNKKLLQYKLVELGLHLKPSAESLEQAYAALKADGMVFAPKADVDTEKDTAPTVRRKRTTSTLTGTGGGNDKPQPGGNQTKKIEISAEQWGAMAEPAQHAWYNARIMEGYKPENIVVKR